MYSQERSMIINHRWKESRRLWTVGEAQYLENLLWGKSPRFLSLIPNSSLASVNITTNQALGYFCGPISLFRHGIFSWSPRAFFSELTSWHYNENLMCFIWESPTRNWDIKKTRKVFMFGKLTVLLTHIFTTFSFFFLQKKKKHLLCKMVNYINEALSMLRYRINEIKSWDLLKSDPRGNKIKHNIGKFTECVKVEKREKIRQYTEVWIN